MTLDVSSHEYHEWREGNEENINIDTRDYTHPTLKCHTIKMIYAPNTFDDIIIGELNRCDPPHKRLY